MEKPPKPESENIPEHEQYDIERLKLTNTEWLRRRLTGELPKRAEGLLTETWKDQTSSRSRKVKKVEELLNLEGVQYEDVKKIVREAVKEDNFPRVAQLLEDEISGPFTVNYLVAMHENDLHRGSMPVGTLERIAQNILKPLLVDMRRTITDETGYGLSGARNHSDYLGRVFENIQNHPEMFERLESAGTSLQDIADEYTLILADQEPAIQELEAYPTHATMQDLLVALEKIYRPIGEETIQPPQSLLSFLRTLYRKRVREYSERIRLPEQDSQYRKYFARIADTLGIDMSVITDVDQQSD